MGKRRPSNEEKAAARGRVRKGLTDIEGGALARQAKRKLEAAQAPREPGELNLVAESKRIGITRGAMGQRIRAWERKGYSREEARVKACSGTPTSGSALKRKPPRGTGDVARRAREAGMAPSTVYKRMAEGKTVEEAITMGKGPPGPKKGTPRPPRAVAPVDQAKVPAKRARRRPTETWDPAGTP